MTSARSRLSRVLIAITTGTGLSLLIAQPASAAAYLKLGDIKGETTAAAGHQDHKGEIEVLSWSFGATNSSHSHSGGMGAGKVSMNDASAAAPGEAEITLKGQGASVGKPNPGRGGNVEYEWKVEEGESASPAPGGVSVAAGDVDGDGRADRVAPRDAPSGLATGKRQHKPMKTTMPIGRSAGSLTVLVPAGMCVVGARYPTAQLGDGQLAYKMKDVMVSSCAPAPSSGGSRPMESLSLNYTKIEF